jgi:hypothetical protein
MQSVPIATKVVSSNHAHGEVDSMQHCVNKFFSDMRHVGGFLPILLFPPPIKLTATLGMIGTDRTGKCKSNYLTTTTTRPPEQNIELIELWTLNILNNVLYTKQCTVSINRNMIFDKFFHRLQNVKQLIFDIRIKETLIFGNQIIFYSYLLIVYITFTALILINWYWCFTWIV